MQEFTVYKFIFILKNKQVVYITMYISLTVNLAKWLIANVFRNLKEQEFSEEGIDLY